MSWPDASTLQPQSVQSGSLAAVASMELHPCSLNSPLNCNGTPASPAVATNDVWKSAVAAVADAILEADDLPSSISSPHKLQKLVNTVVRHPCTTIVMQRVPCQVG